MRDLRGKSNALSRERCSRSSSRRPGDRRVLEGEDEHEEQRRFGSRSFTNRLPTFFFQIRSWGGRCSSSASTTTRSPRPIATRARSVTAATSIAVTWRDIIDTSAGYRSDLNARIASTICGNARTCGRTYAPFIRTASSIASTSSPTRSCLGKNPETTKTVVSGLVLPF